MNMIQEHLDLLTKELCARLPYGVKIKTDFFQTATLISTRKNISLNSGKELSVTYDISGQDEPFQMDERWGTPISEIKLYLIPMSSMTEEQLSYIHFNTKFNIDRFGTITPKIDEDDLPIYVDMEDWISLYDWLNKNHFDYRGLIEKGLALKAPDGMYKQNI